MCYSYWATFIADNYHIQPLIHVIIMSIAALSSFHSISLRETLIDCRISAQHETSTCILLPVVDNIRLSATILSVFVQTMALKWCLELDVETTLKKLCWNQL